MAMTVRRVKDVETPRILMHKIADIRGGVSVKTSELGGDYLPEGAVLAAAVNGVCPVVKVGKVAAATSDTTLKLEKYHNFKVGDFVMAKDGGKAVTISAIDASAKKYDILTLSAALEALEQGSYVAEAKAAATGSSGSKAELKYIPQSIVGTGKVVERNSNLITDAWVIGVTANYPLPDFIASKLKGIVNI